MTTRAYDFIQGKEKNKARNSQILTVKNTKENRDQFWDEQSIIIS